MPRKLRPWETLKLARWGMSHPEEAMSFTEALGRIQKGDLDPALMVKIENIVGAERGELFDYEAVTGQLPPGDDSSLVPYCPQCGNTGSDDFEMRSTGTWGEPDYKMTVACSRCGFEQPMTRELWETLVGGRP